MSRARTGSFGRGGPGRWLAPALICLGALLAYSDSFSGVFVFDDPDSIANNPTIRHLWPTGPVLSPPFSEGQTVGGRPILNLSLAVNHAISGTRVWSYHALNLLVHLVAALALFGIVRRTLLRMERGPIAGGGASAEGDRDAATVALAVALLWAVHPLQTEAVTYIVQRAESMMGMFYLLTLYCFIRHAERGGGRGWAAGAVTACLLGMGTKEVMVSAPVMVFLYDRTFLSGGVREAWRRHRGLHLGLAATWILLARLTLAAHGRGGTSGLGLGVSWWNYVLTQFPAIVHYLRLAAWPHPLIFDYGAAWVGSAWKVLPDMAVAAGWLLGSAILLLQTKSHLRAMGFAGIFFLAILAPSSLVPGIRETMAEHRMYLALAPILAVATAAVAAPLRRFAAPSSALLLAFAATGLIGLTWRRNRVYRSELALWRETAADRPGNAYARNNFGQTLRRRGNLEEAKAEFAEALRLKPDYPQANNNFGNALRDEGRPAEALPYFGAALREQPNYPEAWNDLGVAWLDLGRKKEAAEAFSAALALRPDYPEAHYNLGNVLSAAGQMPRAIEQFETAIRLDPDLPQPRMNLATALAKSGQLERAIAVYREALRRFPAEPELHFNLGNALVLAGRLEEGAGEYEAALRLNPNHEKARINLERVRQMIGQSP